MRSPSRQKLGEKKIKCLTHILTSCTTTSEYQKRIVENSLNRSFSGPIHFLSTWATEIFLSAPLYLGTRRKIFQCMS